MRAFWLIFFLYGIAPALIIVLGTAAYRYAFATPNPNGSYFSETLGPTIIFLIIGLTLALKTKTRVSQTNKD